MLFKLPLEIKHNALAGERAGYYENLKFWWAVADYVFRFVGWCLMTGLVAVAAVKSKSMILSLSTFLLFFIIFIICVKLSIVRFDVEIRGKLASSRLGFVISRGVSFAISLAAATLALYVSGHVALALLNVRSIR